MFDKLFGLPAHSLLIHAPIVLLPIVAILTIVFTIKHGWRHRFGWWMVGAIFITMFLVWTAQESGEAFNEGFDAAFGEGAIAVSQHESLAQTTFLLTVVWYVAFTALVAIEFFQRRNARAASLSAAHDESAPNNPTLGWALGGVASVLAILATVWLIRTGHEGADLVWGPSVDQLFPD